MAEGLPGLGVSPGTSEEETGELRPERPAGIYSPEGIKEEPMHAH